MSTPTDSIPSDYVAHSRKTPLTEPWEPLYCKTVGSALFLALRVREAHCNGRGFVHGGLISALADNSMGYSVKAINAQSSAEATSRGGVTVHLSVDFLGS